MFLDGRIRDSTTGEMVIPRYVVGPPQGRERPVIIEEPPAACVFG